MIDRFLLGFRSLFLSPHHIRQSAPFVHQDPVRGQHGLWEEVAADLLAEGFSADYAYVECDLGDQLRALTAGQLDLVISPLTITSNRLLNFDFSVQYLGSGLTAVQLQKSAIDFSQATQTIRRTLTQPGLVQAIIAFLVLNLLLAWLIAHALRPSERLTGPKTRPGVAVLYVFEAMVRTIGLKGVGDGYLSITAKSLGIFMAVIGTVLSATVFGVLTTAFISAIGSETSIPRRALRISYPTTVSLHGRACLVKLGQNLACS